MNAIGQQEKTGTLLIVEDDLGARDAFKRLLTIRGYRVVTTENEQSAIAEIERESPAALLLDLHLPTSGGVEILRHVRASSEHAGVRVAVMTADYFLDEDVAQEIQRLGARIYFKPIWEDDLLTIVRDLLGGERVNQTR